MSVGRALLSTYDKTGLATFARGLAALDVELVASGGTAGFLEDVGLAVTRVESLTAFPEMLGGRVKTLHPRVHAGILARRDVEEDVRALEENAIEPFDLVCVNLYPFEKAAGGHGVAEEEAVELIDVGGPALLRGAAKNFAHCAPVCRPEDYDEVLGELRAHGEILAETRRSLAARAFAATAAYEAAIARWFAERETFPDTLTIAFDKRLDLAYGENPHQRAAYYAERGSRTDLLSRVEQLHGKPLSFNNLNDLSAARLLVREFQLPACVIVKHANPCGVAVAATIEGAYAKALASDPFSAYGGVVVLNRGVSASLGVSLAGQFVEVLFAPGYDEQAMEVLVRKASIRILNDTERRGPTEAERDYRRVLGGLLVQDRDWDVADREPMEVVTGELSEQQWGDLLFAWRVVKHVTSNAIVLAKGLQTIGIGAGQMSRVDAARIAVEKAHELSHDLEGAVLASDAFFPFADGPQVALEAGIKAIIQPGGSKRDAEVIEAVQSADAAMVFTHRRHFRH
jgi:phosphoribosylaminoimidazolecarboxamide formyltransferase/IMP cyclohydrolase